MTKMTKNHVKKSHFVQWKNVRSNCTKTLISLGESRGCSQTRLAGAKLTFIHAFRDMITRFRSVAKRAVREWRISAEERIGCFNSFISGVLCK